MPEQVRQGEGGGVRETEVSGAQAPTPHVMVTASGSNRPNLNEAPFVSRVPPPIAGTSFAHSHDYAHDELFSLCEPYVNASNVEFANRLQSRISKWRELASPYVCNWIEHGIMVEMICPIPPHCVPSKIQPGAELRFAEDQIKALLQRGVIVRGRPSVVCPLGVAPKKGPKRFRLIHNVRFANEFCVKKHFKYERLTDLQNLLVGGEFMVKFDLEAGYHHIPLHPSQHGLFGFEFQGVRYNWRQLFFGLTSAPYYFTMILRDLAKRWRFDGIMLIHYLDDFLIVAKSKSECRRQMQRVRDDLEALGFVLNLDKSVLEPCQVLDFLGYTVSTVGKPLFQVPAERVAKLMSTLREVRQAGTGWIRVRRVASLAGQLMSMSLALAPARLFTRGLYGVVQPVSRGDQPGGWRAKVRLTVEALSEVAFWLGGLPSWNGQLMFRDPGGVVVDTTSDASHIHGWGGWIFAPQVETHVPREIGTVRTFDAQGRWRELEADEHINLQELRGQLLTLQALRTKIPRGSRVRPRLDNTTAIAYINNSGGRIPLLTAVVKAIWWLALENGWQLEPAVHIPGVRNVHADYLSRVFASCDWMLHPEVFAALDALWGPHTYDRMATRVNRQNGLPFDSFLFDPEATGTDTFLQLWRGHNNWINGDFHQMSRLIAHMRAQGACATCIAPRWARPWWKELVDECVAWRELPQRPDLFLPGDRNSARPGGKCPWRVFAFRLDFRQERVAWSEARRRLPWHAKRM